MFYNRIFNLLQSIQLGETTASEVAVDMAQASSAVSWTTTIVIYLIVIGLMYLFMFRPQKKREVELNQLRDSVKVGDNVVTAGGFFGKVTSIESDRCIVEFGTNKGVLIPVRKTDILPVRTPAKKENAEEEKSQTKIVDKIDEGEGLKVNKKSKK